MKKKIVLLFFTAFVLFGCSQKQEEWDKLRNGMSALEVETFLGPPKEIISNSNEISINAYNDYRTIEKMNTDEVRVSDNFEHPYSEKSTFDYDFESGYPDYDTEMIFLNLVIDESENQNSSATQYVYSIKDSGGKKSNKSIYFINGAVTYIFEQTEQKDEKEK